MAWWGTDNDVNLSDLPQHFGDRSDIMHVDGGSQSTRVVELEGTQCEAIEVDTRNNFNARYHFAAQGAAPAATEQIRSAEIGDQPLPRSRTRRTARHAHHWWCSHRCIRSARTLSCRCRLRACATARTTVHSVVRTNWRRLAHFATLTRQHRAWGVAPVTHLYRLRNGSDCSEVALRWL